MSETRQRRGALNGLTYRIPTGQGKLYLTVNWQEGRIFEVFGNLGHSGSDKRADIEAICRLVSKLLRRDCPVDEIIDQLQGIRGAEPIWHDGRQVTSIADGVAYGLTLAKNETCFRPRLIVVDDEGPDDEEEPPGVGVKSGPMPPTPGWPIEQQLASVGD